ncbi:MAG: ABC transporter substrate-binding protein [Proteobacteria bacterium]|nr:MAG: ABC transporter substrate-binding protein [Pseudomonadota bacterium]
MIRVIKLLAAATMLSAIVLVSQSPWADTAERTARVGFVDPGSQQTAISGIAPFWERLRELGWVEGRNLTVESRWADSQIDRLPGLMSDVLSHKVDVLVTYGTSAALAAKSATGTVPVVVAAMGDPVGTGIASNLSRPGGNVTGISLQWGEDLSGKWFELLQEVLPKVSTIAVIANPESPVVRKITKDLEAVASRRGLKLHFENVRDAAGLSGVFKRARQAAQAALVLPDPITLASRREITGLAAAQRLPTLYVLQEFMETGGMMAYSVDNRIVFRRAAEYVDKILKGTRPGDLPIEQATQFSLMVNLKTAKALGITIPQSILTRADEVIR